MQPVKVPERWSSFPLRIGKLKLIILSLQFSLRWFVSTLDYNCLMTKTISVSRDHQTCKVPVTLACLKNKYTRIWIRKNSFILKVLQENLYLNKVVHKSEHKTKKKYTRRADVFQYVHGVADCSVSLIQVILQFCSQYKVQGCPKAINHSDKYVPSFIRHNPKLPGRFIQFIIHYKFFQSKRFLLFLYSTRLRVHRHLFIYKRLLHEMWATFLL